MQILELSPLQAFRRSIAIVLQAAPRQVRNITVLMLLGGVIPAIVLWLNKLIIDEATRIITGGTTENAINLILSQPQLLISIVALLLLNLLGDSISTITSFTFTSLSDRVKGVVEGLMLEKVSNFQDIALFETPELLNLVTLTEKGVQRLRELIFRLVQTLQGILIFIPAVVLSGALTWWIPLMLLLCTTPAAYVIAKRKLYPAYRSHSKIYVPVLLL